MKEFTRKLATGIQFPKKIYPYFKELLKIRKEVKKIFHQEDFNLTIAVFIYYDIHLNFIHDTIVSLKNEGYSFHFFSTNNDFIGQKLSLNSLKEVKDFRLLKYLPYNVLLTPATFFIFTRIHQKTKIVHMPHSIVSMHDIYPDKIFNAFDVVLCVGPHHMKELRELLKNDNKKHFIAETGYEIVDRFITINKKVEFNETTILFAPSWHEKNLLRTHGERIISMLLNKYKVILRPHPISLDLDAEIIDNLSKKYTKTGRFSLDNNSDATNSFSKAAIMISDYSGAAFEFALGFNSPIVYLDAPRKINNLNWNKYMNEEGVQVTQRERIGVISSFDSLSEDIDKVLNNLEEWETKIKIFIPEILFNKGNCSMIASSQIKSVMDNDLSVFERIE